MNTQGKVFKYPDNVDTDVIIPARYLNTSDAHELAAHCMEDIDKEFVKNVKAGDIMVAGWNFGCGSSREHAPLVIKTCGTGCVIAKSFARIPMYPPRHGPQVGVETTAPASINAVTYPRSTHSLMICIVAGMIIQRTLSATFLPFRISYAACISSILPFVQLPITT